VEVIPAGISASDSATIAKDFIEKWVRNQLLLNKAELNLTDAEKDVELQMESYRSSLLIYAYQQSYLRQSLDTVVTDKEIEEYYDQNRSNFILSESMFKGLFIKVPVTAPEMYKLRQWYRSDDAESIKNLEGYCFQYASIYDDFEESWVKLSEVLRMMPANGGSYETILQWRKYLETRDKDYYFFLNIKEIATEGTVSPFELVKDNIQYIILNKRKIMLINELELNIYSDAQNHEHFTIYQK
jgi:Fe-S cluster biosynthesis and repair protein YggX